MKFIFTLLAIMIGFGCQADNTTAYIPNSAYMVFSMNLHQLNSKSGEMNYLKYLKPFTRTNNYYGSDWGVERCDLININEVFNSPAQFGVSSKTNIYIYKTNIGQVSGTVFLLTLNDAKTFENKLMNECENKSSYHQQSSNNGSFYLSDNISVGINGNIAVIFKKDYSNYDYLSNSISEIDAYDSTYIYDKLNDNYRVDSIYFEQLNRSPKTDNYYQSNRAILERADTNIIHDAQARKEAKIKDVLERKYLSLMAVLESLVQVQSNGLNSDRNFTKLISENHDACFFLNSSSLIYQSNLGVKRLIYGGMEPLNSSKMQNKDLLMSGMSSFYAIDFLEGKAKINFYNVYNDKLAPYVHKMFDVKQNKKLLKYIDGKNLMGYMSFAFNSKEMGKLYADLYTEILDQLTQGSNDYMANLGPGMQLLYAFIDKEMLYNTIDGRMIMACTGFENVKVKFKTYDYDENFVRKEIIEERISKQAQIVAAFSVGNRENAKKLFDIISKFTVFTKLKENVISLKAMREMPTNLYIKLTEDALIITNSSQVALEDVIFNNLKDEDKKLILSHNMVFNVHTPELFKNLQEAIPNEQSLFRFLTYFGDIQLNDTKAEGNNYGATATINLNDSSSNALFQLLKAMKAMH